MNTIPLEEHARWKREPRIKLMPFNSISLTSDRRYLVKGMIPYPGLTLIWGPPKSGKSFWTLDVAMHVAAVNPQVVSAADMPAELVAKEREIFMAQAQDSGKPADIIEKMIEGRLTKFFKEVVLLEQGLVMDPDKTVNKAAQEVGAKVVGFSRFQLGEAGEE